MKNPFKLSMPVVTTQGGYTLEDLKTKFVIDELKKKITATDYKVIKCHEYALVGKPLPYDIEALHAERQALRDRINELEGGDKAWQ